ncbi:MAG: N-acetyltransferase [Chryseolinea sp.]
MLITVARCQLKDIQELRALFLREMNAQFIHDKCHLYGWSDDYVFTVNGVVAGYGCVWGIDRREDRDTIFEFYVLSAYRRHETDIMREFIQISGVAFIECQTNDPNTSRLFFENSSKISVQSILFSDSQLTERPLTGVSVVDKSIPDELKRERKIELQNNGEMIATGGLMLNYNPPFADVYMDVPETHRGKGYGTLIVQELKRVAYEIGRVPVARCRASNLISKATLINAGFRPCGYWLLGRAVSSSEH